MTIDIEHAKYVPGRYAKRRPGATQMVDRFIRELDRQVP